MRAWKDPLFSLHDGDERGRRAGPVGGFDGNSLCFRSRHYLSLGGGRSKNVHESGRHSSGVGDGEAVDGLLLLLWLGVQKL